MVLICFNGVGWGGWAGGSMLGIECLLFEDGGSDAPQSDAAVPSVGERLRSVAVGAFS